MRIRVALILCFAITLSGTLGYMLIEDYSVLEGLYMSVITITTVGFMEVQPLSEVGRGFTTLLIIIGFCSLAYAGHAIAESLLEKAWSGKTELKRMKKQISTLKSHYIICGFGRVGKAAAEHFSNADADFVLIEVNPRHCQELREQGQYFIEGDATHEKVLMEAGIKSARGLLALLESDPDNLFIVLTARELNPTLSIIARAEEASSEKKVLRAGADRVISPFSTAGRQIADDILLATGRKTEITDCIIKPKTIPQWIAAQNGSNMTGKTISGISAEMGKGVIGLRRGGHDSILPDPETIIESDDMLLVIEEELASGKQSQQLHHEVQKVAIVDDNPVILNLYARLFQKAGFNPVTATNGRDALEIIKKEKPVAAVIDFQIPILSGIDVCREVRKTESCQGIKLILFTGDNRPEIRKSAINSGADEVVLKSPEASELIEIVIQTLK